MFTNIFILFLVALAKGQSAADAFSTAEPLLLPSETDSFLGATQCPSVNPKLNYRPVIGILTHPGDGASGRIQNSTDASYIAASYVKFVEAAGARVIPLIYNEPSEILSDKLNLVDGVIFTGGSAKSGLYFEVAESIFKIILRKNEAGDTFPLLAICLGFELVTMMVSEHTQFSPLQQDKDVLEKFNARNQASTLQFAKNSDINGTVFQRFPPCLLKRLSTECLVVQNHMVYVSTVQASKYPVTAVQWHPEKNAFEWGLSMTPHSEAAIQVTQHVANFFVGQARKSMNRPPAQKVLENLIYNHSPTYSGKAGRGFDEVYIFT
ncbi:gamma-glutamyl hydrolase 2-like isoform X3 [Henckelia pumila]|uniref:gamma-glutamyl hydrolase 2-like isoform X3 n=1 Tax=Henckelia pumila TaxID=405737 RepID=UPI003C6E588A